MLSYLYYYCSFLLGSISGWVKGKPKTKRSPQWETLRKSHLRIQSSCQACGRTDHLQVHHIFPVHLFPSKELDPHNLITLCELAGPLGCHLELGHLGDWKSYNPEVVYDSAMWLRKRERRP